MKRVTFLRTLILAPLVSISSLDLEPKEKKKDIFISNDLEDGDWDWEIPIVYTFIGKLERGRYEINKKDQYPETNWEEIKQRVRAEDNKIKIIE